MSAAAAVAAQPQAAANSAPAAAAATNSVHSSHMYRVGDYVYFEVHAGYPYQIRRIEELNRASGSQVEVKVLCFYRRRDIPNALIHLADPAFNDKHPNKRALDNLTNEEKHSLFHRELFLTRQNETVPAQYIRGKCSVNLLSDVELITKYTTSEDSFFYSLVYDPVQKTLHRDQGEIRVGGRFQADVPAIIKQPVISKCEDYEAIEWDPDNKIASENMERYLILTRSVGTFARALDIANTVREPSLHMTAASASRDTTIAYAHTLLASNKYNLEKAMLDLVPNTGPLLCRDQMEEWSASEATLFEEGLEKCGKDFPEIRSMFLPWKPLPSIVEYYYMWKTTDRYMRQKRIKATENDTKLKQVYIPSNGTYNNPNKVPTPAASSQYAQQFECEGCCCKDSSAWFLWGPNNVCRLCEPCWVYWKKFGGLKKPTVYEGGNSAVIREMKYECKACRKTFSRQERLVNHMSQHTEFKCLVEGCDREFKVKNQLHRHLTSVHNLYITTKSSYAEVIKIREPFVMKPLPFIRDARLKFNSIFRKMTKNPFIEPDVDTLAGFKATFEKEGYEAEKRIKPVRKPLAELIEKITELSKNATTSTRKRTLAGNSTTGTSVPYKRLTPSIMPRNVKPVSWLDAKDAILFVAVDKTRKMRDPKKINEYRRASRNLKRSISDAAKIMSPNSGGNDVASDAVQ